MKDHENETMKVKYVFKSYGKNIQMVFSLSFMREENINA
jgi:hypothetical protein